MVCSGLSIRVQLMTFMITLPETKPQNTKTAVAPELIGICPNKPCNPSVLSLRMQVEFPCQMTFNQDLFCIVSTKEKTVKCYNKHVL